MNGITFRHAVEALGCPDERAHELFFEAHKVRLELRGRAVQLCGVVNAKSGHCTENCKFCAQSAHNDARIDCYPLMDDDQLFASSEEAARNRAGRFGIVTSGTAVAERDEIERLVRAIERIAEAGDVAPCASLGNVSAEVLSRLKAAGLTRYHNNLETAQSFFPQICTTKPWSESAQTVRTAKKLGLAVCSGGILGMGESLAQRAELLEALRELDVDSVPLNFLNPIPGTALAGIEPIRPLDCLKVIAVARLMMPEKEIRLCGGREKRLRDLQSWALMSGADGLMVGGYLTTSGRAIEDDWQMIRDAGFEIAGRDAPAGSGVLTD